MKTLLILTENQFASKQYNMEAMAADVTLVVDQHGDIYIKRDAKHVFTRKFWDYLDVGSLLLYMLRTESNKDQDWNLIDKAGCLAEEEHLTEFCTISP